MIDRKEISKSLHAVIKLNGPQTISELSKDTGIPVHHVRAAVNVDADLVPARRGQFGQAYGLAGIHVPKPKELPKAYKYEFKELTPHDHDIYAGRNLALLAR